MEGHTVIVFVHGFLSKAESAWSGSGPDCKSWPEIISEDPLFSGAGIFVCNYRTGVLSGPHRAQDAAKKLAIDFQGFLDTNGHSVLDARRILFVCHSQGGIVVRHLVTTNDALFRKKVVGFAFYASPHAGSQWAKWLKFLPILARNQQGLNLDPRSPELQQVHNAFLQYVKDHGYKVWGREFIEEFPPLRRWIAWLDPIVPFFSANGYFPGAEKILNTDHFSIVKPCSSCHQSHAALQQLWRDFPHPISLGHFDQATTLATATFRLDQYASRSGLERVLDDFYISAKSIFILVSDSGEGKTQAISGEASLRLAGKPRCFVQASVLLSLASVQDVITEAMKSVAPRGMELDQVAPEALWTAREEGRPLVIFADNIIGNLRGADFAEKLNLIAGEAKEIGVKVILTCRTSTWRYVSSHLEHLEQLYVANRSTRNPVSHDFGDTGGSDGQFSYRLTALEDSEITAITNRTLGPALGPALAPILITAPFASLRNAKLLSIYLELFLESHWTAAEAAPTSVDSLLSQTAKRAITKALSNAEVLVDRLGETQTIVVEAMWHHRKEGIRPPILAQGLDAMVSGKGDKLVIELQREGLLTETGTERLEAADRITFAHPQVGDWLLAGKVIEQQWEMPEDLGMVTGEDDGILTAVIRNEHFGQNNNVFEVVTSILGSNKDWVAALCDGIGQLRDEDARVPAFLGCVANHRGEAWLQEALGPLGRRAYRCSSTRSWIETRFNDANHHDSFLAEIAVGFALSLNPEWCVPLILQRVEREAASSGRWSHDLEKRARRIAGALSPLKWISNHRTAVLAKAILDWLDANHPLTKLDEHQRMAQRYDEEFEQARALVLRYVDEPRLVELLGLLRSEDPFERMRAALALHILAIDEPGYPGLRDAIVSALSNEHEVVAHMLQLAFIYALNGELAVAGAIANANLNEDYRASLAIVELGLLARQDVGQILGILPSNLEPYNGMRAMLGEPLAVAWTRIGINGKPDEAEVVLSQLSAPDLDMEEKGFCFAYRGAAIAVLGRIVLSIPESHVEFGRVNCISHYRATETNLGFCYHDFETLLTEFGNLIAAHHLADQYIELLNASIQASLDHFVHPVERELSEWTFRAQQLCATEASLLVPHLPSPIERAQSLSGGIPTVRTCNELARRGLFVSEAMDISADILSRPSDFPHAQFTHDQTVFTVLRNSVAAKSEEMGHLLRHRWRGRTFARELGGLEVKTFAEALEHLEQGLATWQSIEFLFEWPSTTRDYLSGLLSSACRQCLLQNPMTVDQAVNICNEVLGLVAGEEPETEVLSTRQLFTYCKAELEGRNPVALDGSTLGTFWATSIACAQAVLNVDLTQETNAYRKAVLEEVARFPARIYNPSTIICVDGITHGNNLAGTVWLPPAVRVSIVLASQRKGIEDIWGEFLQERRGVIAAFNEHPFRMVFSPGVQEHYPERFESDLQASLEQINDLVVIHPLLADVFLKQATILLKKGLLLQALEATEKGLSAPQLFAETTADLQYDRASCLCKLDRLDEVQSLLESAFRLNPILIAHSKQDVDLKSIHGSEWFQKIQPPTY